MIYIDLETTGFDGNEDDIIEIFMIKENLEGNIIEELHFFINTKIKLSPKIIELTNLTNEKLKHEKMFTELAPKIIEFIGEKTLVGHNIDNFDLPFLNANLVKNGFNKIMNQTIDTMLMAREIDRVGKYERGYKLIDLCKKHRIEFDETKMHGAKYDTYLTRKLYKKLLDLSK